MSAIITTGFRVSNAKTFINSSDDYFMFIGRPQPWTDDLSPDTPTDSMNHDYRSWESMFAMKKIVPSSNMSHGITKRVWTSGKYYDAYRHDYGQTEVKGKHIDTGAQTTPENLAAANYYVVTSNNSVYICVTAGTGTSTVNPQSLSLNANYYGTGADGYTWKKVAVVSSADATKFSTPNFHPVKTLSANPGDSDEYYTQWLSQQNAATIGGAILNVVLNGGGSGYGNNLTNQAGVATVKGDGTGATVGITTNGTGTITALTVNNIGSGYTWAAIEFATGTGATATPIITPIGGLGADPVEDLCAFNVITNVRFEYADGGDFPVTNEYRRVGMIVNPFDYGTSTVVSTTTASPCLTIKVSSPTGTFSPDQVIKDATTGAHARVVDVQDGAGGDAGKKILRVIRTREDNQLATAVASASFVGGNVLSAVSGGTGAGTIDSIINPEVQPRSGRIIYVENRRPISRSIDQVESITTVFEY